MTKFLHLHYRFKLSMTLLLCTFRYEAGTLLILYALYIVLMYFNSSISAWIVPRTTCCRTEKIDEESELVVYDKADVTDSEDEG